MWFKWNFFRLAFCGCETNDVEIPALKLSPADLSKFKGKNCSLFCVERILKIQIFSLYISTNLVLSRTLNRFVGISTSFKYEY